MKKKRENSCHFHCGCDAVLTCGIVNSDIEFYNFHSKKYIRKYILLQMSFSKELYSAELCLFWPPACSFNHQSVHILAAFKPFITSKNWLRVIARKQSSNGDGGSHSSSGGCSSHLSFRFVSSIKWEIIFSTQYAKMMISFALPPPPPPPPTSALAPALSLSHSFRLFSVYFPMAQCVNY